MKRRGLGGVALLAAVALPAAASTSTARNPVVSFGSSGPKQVTLTVCNGYGCSTSTQTVVVLETFPTSAVAIALPSVVFEGDLLTLSGEAYGLPPLTFTWRVLAADNSVVGTASGRLAYWSADVPPGTYTVALDVTNSVEPPVLASASPVVVTVVPWPGLFRDSFEEGGGRWNGGLCPEP
jgi:PKD repeat protein